MLGGTQRDHGTVDMSYDNNSVCIPETSTGTMGPSVQRHGSINEDHRLATGSAAGSGFEARPTRPVRRPVRRQLSHLSSL